MNNFNTWLAYFPYENPLDNDPVNILTSCKVPAQAAQLFTHKKYPGNILMVPPGGSAFVYNATNPNGATTFRINNKLFPNHEPNETIITPGSLLRTSENSAFPYNFLPMDRNPDTDPIILKKHTIPEDLSGLNVIDSEDFVEETEGQVYFKNGLLRVLHDILPTSFLEVPENYIANAITIPIKSLPIQFS